MVKNQNDSLVVIQRILGVSITVGIFIFLTINGEEIPERVQRLMVLGVGSLIVGVDGIMSIVKLFKSIRFEPPKHLEDNEKEGEKRK